MKSEKRQSFQKSPGRLLTVLMLVLASMTVSEMAVAGAAADLNILIIGSTKDSGERHNTSVWWNAQKPAYVPKSKPFSPTEIGTQLQNILAQDNRGTVNVTVLERYASQSMSIGWTAYSYNLETWFHYPYPAGAEANRWADLRGEAGTQWDYVVLIGDPYTMEYTPGVYAHGVAKIAEEVSKGPAQLVLLMPWPGSGSTSSVNHYKEVVYRTGRSGGFKVAPGGLAWQACGSPTSTAHPSTAGAYIAASSIYSCIYNQSAAASGYVYNDTYANTTFTTYTNNNSAQQYTGIFSFQNPYRILDDRRRDVHMSERGTSTEDGFKSKVKTAMNRAMVTYVDGVYNDKYNSNTPADDGLGWPSANPMPIAFNYGRDGIYSEATKCYVVNPAYWQAAFGYYYQNNTWAETVETANDLFIGLMQMQDNDLANRMINEAPTARNLPVRTLWAQIHKENSTLNPLRDGSGPHLNYMEDEAVGSYMYTLYSGRCPLDPQPASPDITWTSRRIGYETAWRMGRCSARAPGFKVTPSAATKKTIMAGTTETMSVRFIFQPTSNVTVNISISNPAAASPSVTQMTFTPSNYSTPQTVVITAGNVPSDQSFTVDYSTVSTDEAYNNVYDSWEYTALRFVPSVAWTAASQSSANESGTLTVTAQLSVSFGQNVTVPFTLSGTATSGADYSIAASPIVIPSGSTTGTATITIAGDLLDEANETVILTMGTPTNATLGSPTVHTATIIDDDPTPTVNWTTASQASANESGTMLVTAQLTAVSGRSVTVPFTVTGTATSGTDYTITASPITIPAGSSSASATITIVNDTAVEITETVILTMGTPTNATKGATSVHTATITDDDGDPTVEWTATSQTSAGELGTLTVTAKLSRTATKIATIPLTITGTATGGGTDYTISTNPIMIPIGASAGSVTITIVDDLLDETNETVILTIDTPTNALLGPNAVHTATITDDDATPTVAWTAASQTASVENGNRAVTAQLSAASGRDVTVPYTITGTATNGTDYTVTVSPIVIPAGSTTATATIAITDDVLDEANETVILTIGTPVNATKGTPAAHTLTITDDDPLPLVSFTQPSQASANESGTMTVTARLSAVSGRNVSVPFTVSGTATGAGTDYTITASPITITAGSLTGSATITITSETLVESDETVILTMGTVTNSTKVAPTVHTATITDDDGATPTANWTFVSQASAAESGTMTATVVLSKTSALAVTVPFTVSGTATPGTDFTVTGSPIIISAGATTGTATITITADTAFEGNETVILTMGTLTNATKGAASVHTATITDDDVNATPIIDSGPSANPNPVVRTETTVLSVTAHDDGLPNPPSALTYTWSKVSGPGTVTFGANNGTTTGNTCVAGFSASGTYLIQVVVSDSQFTASGQVSVTVVDPPNAPPLVDAGPEQMVVLSPGTPSLTINLDGTISDPDNDPFTSTWSVVSGPAAVTFGNASAVDTTATFTVWGTYILRLTATDAADQTTTDDVVIIVNEYSGCGGEIPANPNPKG